MSYYITAFLFYAAHGLDLLSKAAFAIWDGVDGTATERRRDDGVSWN